MAEAGCHAAFDAGLTPDDTAHACASGRNEERARQATAGRRQRVVPATEPGNERPADGTRTINGKWAQVDNTCERSLRHGVETIDVNFARRLDPDVPIEDTVGAMSDLRIQ